MSAYKCLVTSILQSNTHYKHYVVNSDMVSYFAFWKFKTDDLKAKLKQRNVNVRSLERMKFECEKCKLVKFKLVNLSL